MMRRSPPSTRVQHALIVLSIVAMPLAPAWSGALHDAAGRPLISLGGVFGASFQPWEATSSATICRNGSFSTSCTSLEPLRPFESGEDTDSTPYVGGLLEVMSPEIPIPGTPRFFAGAELVRNIGLSRKVALEGDPGPITSPIPAAAAGQTGYAEDNALGNGSETTASSGDLAYGAFAGIAFPFEWLDRDFMIRPSVSWLRFEVDVEGFASDAECQQFRSGPNTVTRCVTTTTTGPGFLRETSLRASTTETFDAVGPGIDLEMEIGRVGQFAITAHTGARFYKVLGNREVVLTDGPDRFSDPVVDPPGGSDEARARFGFEVDSWIYRLGIGVRLTWLGLGSN